MFRKSFPDETVFADTFKLLCYNILCEKYATPQAYGYTPSWALAWEWRKELIIEDVLMYSADIVCLQASRLLLGSLVPFYIVC
jgi:mRNA deadenylase 3'-5' endonuclease subunit Ccr4